MHLPMPGGLRDQVCCPTPAPLLPPHHPPSHSTLRAPPPPADFDPTNTTLFIGGLSGGVSEDQLRAAFARFGDIIYVKIPAVRGAGCGWVGQGVGGSWAGHRWASREEPCGVAGLGFGHGLDHCGLGWERGWSAGPSGEAGKGANKPGCPGCTGRGKVPHCWTRNCCRGCRHPSLAQRSSCASRCMPAAPLGALAQHMPPLPVLLPWPDACFLPPFASLSPACRARAAGLCSLCCAPLLSGPWRR